MPENLIIESITRNIRLENDEKKRFLGLLQPDTFKKKQFVLEEGRVCKNSTFVLKGCLRGYTVDRNGFEHVLNFAPAGWWIADMYSLISQQPGNLFIQALEETQVYLLSKENQEKLYQEIPQFERFFRIITENSLVAYQQRITENLSLDTGQRYHNFCKRYPSLINSLPQKEIASYLGVTAEFFSRMQRRESKKHN